MVALVVRWTVLLVCSSMNPVLAAGNFDTEGLQPYIMMGMVAQGIIRVWLVTQWLVWYQSMEIQEKVQVG